LKSDNRYKGDPDLQRLCDEAMHDSPPPDGFRTREDWVRYNDEQDRRDRNKAIFGFKDI
jgi:hypothetical protein